MSEVSLHPPWPGRHLMERYIIPKSKSCWTLIAWLNGFGIHCRFFAFDRVWPSARSLRRRRKNKRRRASRAHSRSRSPQTSRLSAALPMRLARSRRPSTSNPVSSAPEAVIVSSPLCCYSSLFCDPPRLHLHFLPFLSTSSPKKDWGCTSCCDSCGSRCYDLCCVVVVVLLYSCCKCAHLPLQCVNRKCLALCASNRL